MSLEFNFSKEHVQSEIENGEYISSEATVLLAGPSRFDRYVRGVAGAQSLFPIGLVGQIRIGQEKPIERLYEIGSKRAYFIPGRFRGTLDMARTMFYGPSLMRLLYAAAPTSSVWGTALTASGRPVATSPEYAKLFGPATEFNKFSEPGTGGTPAEATAGNENRDSWMSLISEVFNVPFGMALLMKDSKNRSYGSAYLEDCYLDSHRIDVSIQSVVMTESVTGVFDRVVPCQLSGGVLG